MASAILYVQPDRWFRYDPVALAPALVKARAAVEALRMLPYQRDWVAELQRMELKREVAGTSRIEGADFTESELEAALHESPEDLLTRSQRQASAAMRAYRWISGVADDIPVNETLIDAVHRLIVEGADDDHCPPGVLRGPDQNVVFGSPPHRGAEGGRECAAAFASLLEAVQREGTAHDPLVLALAVHYHLAAIHPFLDGNGRTARAMEALLLGRAGLKDVCFIAMSNYYYDEKREYLASLSEVRRREGDLTPFLKFALRGIETQSKRLLTEIRKNVSRALFRNMMHDLFDRLRSPKRRLIAKRQLRILEVLLAKSSIPLETLRQETKNSYRSLKNPFKAFIRDLNHLIFLRAITAKRPPEGGFTISVNLQWPTEITQTEFFEKVKNMPKAKTSLVVS